MTSRLVRGLAVGLAGLLAAGTVVATAPGAAAAAPVFHAPFKPVVGDVTGDGIADRVALGTLTRADGSYTCAYQLAAGLGHGQFAGATTGKLPVRDDVPDDGFLFCPDLGTVLKGPTPALNQLATTYFDFGPYDGPQVQIFKGFGGQVKFTGGFDGVYQASYIRSLDFDGDGYGDAYEYTDQGGMTQYWTGRGNSWRPFDPYPLGGLYDAPQFLDLNHNGGLDVLASTSDGRTDLGVSVADGRTGAAQVLIRARPQDDPDAYTSYDATVVDLNHDTLPDIRVAERLGGAQPTYHYFRNESKNGHWYFRDVTPGT